MYTKNPETGDYPRGERKTHITRQQHNAIRPRAADDFRRNGNRISLARNTHIQQ